ncbi:energy-coupling factor transporter transmembrane protein EcfT [Treponema sp. OMZ 792]|uniref:energy-coupling factor transporter transmembrane component T family protein n=1 Tax=unclassified Treponema TaxID=2638727 RepID=UPI0020A3A5F1|nr:MULTISPECIES: energy-coupling factor transporter transmembrane component T [unclassified Treponema]UTC75412.1 energy-coupling factor transporter transmembrane protein EcfT [Treponema sp. OMZ 792]UTC79414.1 energy-coupling factor transporter transmembrane protein EcfT [Treponema sp. OMZ 798]
MKKDALVVLDPRTKIFLVLAMGASITILVPIYVEILSAGLLAFLFLMNGQVKSAIKLMAVFLFFAALTYLPKNLSGVTTVVLPVGFMVRRFMMPIVAGNYLIASTPVGLLMNALEKLKLPYSIVITAAVMFRFFPTLKEEYGNIKNAMKMRGIGLNAVNVITKPLLTLEYVMVPLLSSASRIGDELAAAGHTKGVDAPLKKVRYKTSRFTGADVVIFIYIIAVFIAAAITRIHS